MLRKLLQDTQKEDGKMNIGVLSLQGGVIEHLNQIKDILQEQFDEFCKSYENNYGNTEVTS